MAHTIPQYLQKAAHNLAFAEHIRGNKTDCLDWAATCLFYSAVHYVNAYLAKVGKPIPRRHTSRDPLSPGRTNIVQQDSTLSKIYKPYRHLDDESRDARYELRNISESDYDNFLLPQLKKIKTFIEPNVK